MSARYCLKCKVFYDDAEHCPICGNELNTANKECMCGRVNYQWDTYCRACGEKLEK